MAANTKYNIARAKVRQLRLLGMTSNDTLVVPRGYAIQSIFVAETAAAAITGGLDIGTAALGAEVVSAMTVDASTLYKLADSALIKSYFSKTLDTPLYISAHTSWNSAAIDIILVLHKLY